MVMQNVFSSALVVRHLRFLKLIFVIAGELEHSFCIIMPHFVEISHTAAEILRFSKEM